MDEANRDDLYPNSENKKNKGYKNLHHQYTQKKKFDTHAGLPNWHARTHASLIITRSTQRKKARAYNPTFILTKSFGY